MGITPLGLTWLGDLSRLFKMKKYTLQTVVETPEFIKQSSYFFDEDSKEAFIKFIAQNPLEGDLIPGTGGARKIRWQSEAGGGKRSGARIIYYYHNENIPIFLFTAYKKNQKENITATEKKLLKKIINLIVDSYER